MTIWIKKRDFWVNEGPAVIKHNGKIFLTFSASATGACYCVGMLTAEEDFDLFFQIPFHPKKMPEKKIHLQVHTAFYLFLPMFLSLDQHPCILTNKDNFKYTDYNEPFIAQRADPYVYKHTDGTYYFTASVPAYDKIILRHADTIMGLTSI